ncbi:pentatricopeptide repeat-containing At1g56690, mitochondrial-like isoform X1 [Olea europaea subsp. europaea]|uniref:Pentatricopeptide repeat-containing At1g56690, mitochondrial-like isoform X1 n=1 Tax=Olea europaea subsp. europaea TaxID=158383 RepID=A0A8S0SZP6_OLEEU|nr:pentatricopeptide repeat-containing At1g56690, mitochondrial-like isoform X1 [Olea europaea subsp. europaea]
MAVADLGRKTGVYVHWWFEHTHLEHFMIIILLEKLSGPLREVGYNLDGSCTVHYMEEEEKAYSLGYHSEKLALAYRLVKFSQRVPIRVTKYMSVRGDCHAAIELFAEVIGQEIILKDVNRFYHFKDVLYFCKDY